MNIPPKLTDEQCEQLRLQHHINISDDDFRVIESIRDQQWLTTLAARVPDGCPSCGSTQMECAVCAAGFAAAPQVQQEPSKCAQCQKPYRHGATTPGCPKCAPGLVVSEAEFQEPIAPQQPENATNNHTQLLADALGKCILASGIVSKDKDGFTGPELLLFAKDLEDMLKSSQPAKQPSDDPCPGCMKDTVCRTPSCGRLKLREKNGDKQ